MQNLKENENYGKYKILNYFSFLGAQKYIYNVFWEKRFKTRDEQGINNVAQNGIKLGMTIALFLFKIKLLISVLDSLHKSKTNSHSVQIYPQIQKLFHFYFLTSY